MSNNAEDDVEDIFASFSELQGEREIIHTPVLVRFGSVAVTAAPKCTSLAPSTLPGRSLTGPLLLVAGEAIHKMSDQFFSSGVVRLS